MNKKYSEDFGLRVLERRKELHISQEELANKMGYKSRASIHKIEKGLVEIPLSKLKRLADILDLNILELMGYKI